MLISLLTELLFINLEQFTTAMKSIFIPALIAITSFAASCFASDSFSALYGTAQGLSHRNPGSAVQDRNGLLWISTWNGLNCFDGYEFYCIRLSPSDSVADATNHIRDIMLSDDGNILCHTDEDIFEFSLDSFSFRDIPAHRKDSLAKIMGRKWAGLTDRQWNVWTATAGGILKQSSHHYPASIIPETAGQHPRATMLDREGRLWVGTSRDKGVNIYDGSGHFIERIPLDSAPYAIFQSTDGTVWIGCKPGALIKAYGQAVSDDVVYDIAEDSAGNIWLATFNGGVKVIARKGDAYSAPSQSLGGRRARRILVTPSQNIFAATNSGLLIGKINLSNPAMTRLRLLRRQPGDINSLSSNTLMDVARDNRGNIYVATESSGIDMISEKSLMGDNPAFTHLTAANGALPSDNVLGMTFDGDSILMVVGADNVAALDVNSLKSTNFNSTFWVDSCRFAECRPLRLADGSWVLASEQGALRASASSLWSRGYIPNIVFTTISLPDRAPRFCLTGKPELQLDAHSRNLTVKYAAIDFTNNSQIHYRTRLDGSDWAPQGTSRSITLFNLAPGRHTLQVQSTDCYGRWVDNVAELVIVVEPLWHETWWAKALFFLSALAAAGFLAWGALYVRSVERQRRELLAKYMELLAGNSDQPSPDTPPAKRQIDDTLSEYDKAFLERVRRYVDDNIANPEAGVDEMAQAVAVSRSTLNRKLKSKLGISPAQLLIEARLQRAAMLLKESPSMSATELAEKCGYSDAQYFQRSFRKRFGSTSSGHIG